MKGWRLGALFVVLLCVAACGGRFGGKTPSEPVSISDEFEEDLPRDSAYYDFEDIPVHRKMKLEPEPSLLFETRNLKAGRICFKGRLDPVELFEFFVVNMPSENWQLRSYFKYGVYLLVFEKPDRDCIISINKSTFNTQLEIWVTPHLGPE
ncbi:MAG: hypothetical protein ACLFUE_02075 [Desulfobacteraceae bacterium]